MNEVKTSRTGEAVIAVRILIIEEVAPVLVGFMPEGNRIATELLLRLLTVRLEAADIELASSIAAFPFSSALYMFTLKRKCDLGAALRIVQEELTKLNLFPMAHVGFWDENELIFRATKSELGGVPMPSATELADEKTTTEYMQAKIWAVMRE